MKTYLKTTFFTIFGLRDLITLSDFDYGEWIVFDKNKPAYHISCFRENSVSDEMIYQLLKEKKETIESIVNKINKVKGTKLNFGKTLSLLRIKTKEELIELDLNPLPESWIKAI